MMRVCGDKDIKVKPGFDIREYSIVITPFLKYALWPLSFLRGPEECFATVQAADGSSSLAFKSLDRVFNQDWWPLGVDSHPHAKRLKAHVLKCPMHKIVFLQVRLHVRKDGIGLKID